MKMNPILLVFTTFSTLFFLAVGIKGIASASLLPQDTCRTLVTRLGNWHWVATCTGGCGQTGGDMQEMLRTRPGRDLVLLPLQIGGPIRGGGRIDSKHGLHSQGSRLPRRNSTVSPRGLLQEELLRELPASKSFKDGRRRHGGCLPLPGQLDLGSPHIFFP